MFLRLLLLLTLVPALELVLIHRAAKVVGVGWTVFLIVLTGVVGSALAKVQGLAVLRRTQEELARGQMPSHGLMDGVLILSGAVLLLTPGFLTDLLGLVCLVPWSREVVKAQLRRRLERWLESGGVQVVIEGPR